MPTNGAVIAPDGRLAKLYNSCVDNGLVTTGLLCSQTLGSNLVVHFGAGGRWMFSMMECCLAKQSAV